MWFFTTLFGKYIFTYVRPSEIIIGGIPIVEKYDSMNCFNFIGYMTVFKHM